MGIQKVYMGTWIPRTRLHLEEVYDFLTGAYRKAGIDENRTRTLLDPLQISSVVLHEETEIDHIIAEINGFEFLFTEDGIVIVSTETSVSTLSADQDKVEAFLRDSIAPALHYIFGRGAPIVKKLSEVKEHYPLILLGTGLSMEEAENILIGMEQRVISKIDGGEVKLISGTQHIIASFDSHASLSSHANNLIQSLIFTREFERQLGHYLESHRSIWNEITNIREAKHIRYRDFASVRAKIMSIQKQLSFVKARLEQMQDVLEVRAVLLRDNDEGKMLRALGLERSRHLKSERAYMTDLWQMTIEYAEGTLSLLHSLFEENTQRELSALKFISFIAAVTSFFGMNIAFPWEERWGLVYASSIDVVILIGTVTVMFYFALRYFIYNRRFVVKE